MAAAGFGFGLGLQGAPREHTSIYMQRKQQEFAAKQQAEALRRKQAEEDAQYLDKFIIKDNVDDKLKPIVQKATAAALNEAMNAQKEYPLTYRNKTNPLMLKTQQLVGTYEEMSKNYADARDILKSGKARTSDNMAKFFNESPGDFVSHRDGTEPLYGLNVNDQTGRIQYKPVLAIDIPQEVQTRIFNQKGAMIEEKDAKGNPTTFLIGGTEHRKERLNIPFVTQEFKNLMQNENFKSNVYLDYLEKIKAEPGFDVNKVVDETGKIRKEFTEKAESEALAQVINAGKQLQDIQALPKPGNTYIVNNNGGDDYTAQFEVNRTPFKMGWTDPVTGKDGEYKDATGLQTTFKAVKVTAQDNTETISTDSNKPLEKGTVRETSYGQVAVLPYYKKGTVLEVGGKMIDVSGMLVHDDALYSPTTQNTKYTDGSSIVEFKVVGVGKAELKGGRSQPITTPIGNIRNSLIQAMSDERKREGKTFTKNEKELFDKAMNQLEDEARVMNEQFGNKVTTPAPKKDDAVKDPNPKYRYTQEDGKYYRWTYDPATKGYGNDVEVPKSEVGKQD